MPGIRTAYRCKIGSHIVYPLRLAEVQNSLDSATATFDIAVKFFDYKAPKQGEARTSYPIAEISYDPDDPNQREVTLRPFPKGLHFEVNEKLKILFTQKVTPWLLKKHPLGWEQKYHALRISYDIEMKNFVMIEFNAA